MASTAGAAAATAAKGLGKLAFVTGANRGIGLEVTRQLVEAGVSVYAGCRKTSEALDALKPTKIVTGVDVGKDAVEAVLAKEVGDVTFDLVINVAGILNVDKLDGMKFDSLRDQMEVNAFGPLRVARAVKLANPAKYIVITSRMGSIGDNGSGGMYGYRMSKAAVNMATVSLARDWKDKGVAVQTIHPGMVATDMTAAFGATGIPASESAAGILKQISALD
eukprot:CAMPEP_0197623364 /NCGR_PEP_ID=MMETSP1338-20131121/3399_1 /TAXON_ID=43686 ORGANISM="Pelagodinium beii, Strain RCC1491" /NCGR_SAMPLE_ID=MMETSP1338 /ASSEMBLY_ACC=CAM_ASM_000754 /LENGTH=220 /DNA_ID=CAMNT_0043193317 /DNA_START=75 /DNA_END=734 /DNA_ORIENTATION=+